jgi:hypothetical protein
MAFTQKKTRVVGNPVGRAFGTSRYKKTRATGGHRARRVQNVGHIIGYALGNPAETRKKGMAKAKKYQRKNTAKKSHHSGGKRKYANPGKMQMHYKRRRTANPGMSSSVTELVTSAVFVILGALGSKLGAQAVLGTNNTGVMGYAGNAAVGAALWFITEKLMKNRAASSGIISGTIVQILLRVINDYTPFGSYVAQLGMGDYQMQSFVTPQVLVDPLNDARIAIPDGWGGNSNGGGHGGGRTAGIVPANTPMMLSAKANSSPAAAPAAPGTSGVGSLYDVGGGGLYAV